MNAFTRRFPEIERYAMSEARPGRLVTAAVTSLVVGGCLYASTAASSSQDSGSALFGAAFWLQAMILLLYGTSRTTGSVLTERLEKTWDLQRLTPMSSWELSIGKLLGAPILAFYLAALFIPWAAAGLATSSTLPMREVMWDYLLLAGTTFFSLSLGLLVSSHGEGSVGGASAGTAGALMGAFGLSFLGSAMTSTGASKGGTLIPFFGRPCPLEFVILFSAVFFGAWALAGARWRLGRELLEPRRAWRLPAFILSLAAYERALGVPPFMTLIAPGVVMYFASWMSGRRPMKVWLAAPPRLWWDRMPSWIGGAAACVCAACVLATLDQGPQTQSSPATVRFYPLILCGFIIRDLAFLQLCRFSKSRSPEVMAMIFIGLAYALPSIVLGAAKASVLLYLFMPAPSESLPILANLAPGWLQAAGVCLLIKNRRG